MMPVGQMAGWLPHKVSAAKHVFDVRQIDKPAVVSF